jgi:molecular chaperone GrpE
MEALVSSDSEKMINEEQVNEPVNTAEQASSDAAEEIVRDQDSAQTEQEDKKDWKAEAQTLAQQMAELKEQALRVQADAQNVRRRAEMDVEKAHKFALEKFAKELLPVIDSLEKAVEAELASGNEMTPLREGVEMTLSLFLSAISKFNLEQIDPVGKPFDPGMHEAMSLVEVPNAEPNTVIAAMQKGYTLNGRLVRPAMVMVSKNSAANSTKIDEQA